MKLAKHKPIRAKYSPTPSAKEKRFHLWLMQQPCLACGLESCGVAHHLMTPAPHKRWRRDHEMMLNLCHDCHCELHLHGNEREWATAKGFNPVVAALENRAAGRQQGII